MATMTKKTIITFAKLDDPDGPSPRQEPFFHALMANWMKVALRDGVGDPDGVKQETETTSIRTRLWVDQATAQAYLDAVATTAASYPELVNVMSAEIAENI